MTPILWDHDNYDLAVGPPCRVQGPWSCWATRARPVPETVPPEVRRTRVGRIIVIRGLSSWAELRKAA